MPPTFRLLPIMAKWLDGSGYHLVRRYASAESTLLDGNPRPPTKRSTAARHFSDHCSGPHAAGPHFTHNSYCWLSSMRHAALMAILRIIATRLVSNNFSVITWLLGIHLGGMLLLLLLLQLNRRRHFVNDFAHICHRYFAVSRAQNNYVICMSVCMH